MRIITIIGARPQFVKAAAVSRAIIRHNHTTERHIDERMIHTGQHYDEAMSRIFFDDLQLPPPTWQLSCEHGSHARMTADMMVAIEQILVDQQPDCVVVYGDTNSTLAGALTAAKLHIPVAHIEAGLRSFNRRMPEEINRILTDHVSAWLFCPTRTAVKHLKDEHITHNVFHTGDVMYDATLIFGEVAERTSDIISKLQLTPKQFCLCTVHRAENTDNPDRLGNIMQALQQIGRPDCPIVMPLHPRTHNRLSQYGMLPKTDAALRIVEPLGYLDMTMLEKHASAILTDSGGVQKEAYFHRTPCITLRDETEWIETIEAGWNRLTGCDPIRIIDAFQQRQTGADIDEYGDGHAADRIIELLTAPQ